MNALALYMKITGGNVSSATILNFLTTKQNCVKNAKKITTMTLRKINARNALCKDLGLTENYAHNAFSRHILNLK